MKFKLDENFGKRCVEVLTTGGHDVVTVAGQRMSGAACHLASGPCARLLVRKQRNVLVRSPMNFGFRLQGERCSIPMTCAHDETLCISDEMSCEIEKADSKLREVSCTIPRMDSETRKMACTGHEMSCEIQEVDREMREMSRVRQVMSCIPQKMDSGVREVSCDT